MLGTLLRCFSGLATIGLLHKKVVPWALSVLQFIANLKNATASETTTTSVTVESVSLRCFVRGVEIRLSNGVVVRIGRLSFGTMLPLLLPVLLLALLLLLQLRILLLVLLLVPSLLLAPLLLRQHPLLGQGRAIVITVENARVSLPVPPSTSKAAPKTAAEETHGKDIALPGVALLCARFVAVEVRDLRVEFVTGKNVRSSPCRGGAVGPDDKGSHDENGSVGAASPPAAGLRAIELVGVRLMGFVSKRSSLLTVRYTVLVNSCAPGAHTYCKQ